MNILESFHEKVKGVDGVMRDEHIYKFDLEIAYSRHSHQR